MKAFALLAFLIASTAQAAVTTQGTVVGATPQLACGDLSNAATSCSSATPTRTTKTVSTLPTCNGATAGQMFFVTDALTPVALAAVVPGGAITIGVTCLNSAWVVQ